jgi:hypothetical protein
MKLLEYHCEGQGGCSRAAGPQNGYIDAVQVYPFTPGAPYQV